MAWLEADVAVRRLASGTVALDGLSGLSSTMSECDLPVAVAALITAHSEYAAVQADTDTVLAEAQRRRETAMRRVAALGLSHRRIGELTGLPTPA